MTYNDKSYTRFVGFKKKYTKDFFTYPTILEGYWEQLTGAEQKALDFILRQTFGFQKTSDKISLSQFVGGIGSKNKGAGISRAQVPRVLKSLEEKGFIVTEKTKFHTTEICLALAGDYEEPLVSTEDTSGTSPTVLALLEMFRVIAPHQTDEFKTSKKQIEAMVSLLQHYNSEQLVQMIQLAQVANGKQYAPTITSPVELAKKLASLLAYVRKHKDGESNGFKVSL